eukprot:gnl/Chilomastix_caulleri/2713.p1 GENE.gnl/Chilomastix_caulleri/2713~~gnl/Chilomastix_caulleri/2713.p1  ORF type:complete len:84 (+),score=24.95 gnl/Chilomastix_caulleri/2713:169-420(+)
MGMGVMDVRGWSHSCLKRAKMLQAERMRHLTPIVIPDGSNNTLWEHGEGCAQLVGILNAITGIGIDASHHQQESVLLSLISQK